MRAYLCQVEPKLFAREVAFVGSFRKEVLRSPIVNVVGENQRRSVVGCLYALTERRYQVIGIITEQRIVSLQAWANLLKKECLDQIRRGHSSERLRELLIAIIVSDLASRLRFFKLFEGAP
ncbi:hypothetical protein SAMN05518801_109136 [Novosphingobium sp. CF614]|nr:hypothetical protein SAMN05518801_109136 [Novosphingobium sp. CF614]